MQGLIPCHVVRRWKAHPCAIRPTGDQECRPRQDGIAANLAPRASCTLLDEGGGLHISFGVWTFVSDRLVYHALEIVI